eukprot:1673661-Prymnesium_polylepis.1
MASRSSSVSVSWPRSRAKSKSLVSTPTVTRRSTATTPATLSTHTVCTGIMCVAKSASHTRACESLAAALPSAVWVGGHVGSRRQRVALRVVRRQA